MPTAAEVVQAKMDEFGANFAEYRKLNDQAVAELKEKGKLSEETAQKMGTLEQKLQSFDSVKAEYDAVKARIDQLEASIKRTGKGGSEPEDPSRPFKSLGEQLKAVAKAEIKGEAVDPRLGQILRAKAASGLNETIPSEGGFLVQTDMSSELLKRTYETGQILQRVRRIPISANANGLKINYINETSRATGSRHGGVTVYWPDEAGLKTASKPSFGQLELTLNKAVALCYATDELLEDAVALESVIMDTFPQEMSFSIEDKFVRGTGAGVPLGILNSGATVTQAARVGQPTASIIYENVVDMWSRLWARSQQNAVWMINQDCFPQLATMSLAVGTGGAPVYIPANGAAGAPYGTIFGRPVLISEYCSTVGTIGDIMLVDWSTYLTIDKGGLKTDSSMHVRFVYDEMCYRFVTRVDGQPTWQSVLTPYQGTNTVSPVIVLATRP